MVEGGSNGILIGGTIALPLLLEETNAHPPVR